jgi:ATPase subunit of ABC transporter with duplicated ATPase domains
MSAFVTLDAVAYATPDAHSLFDNLTLAFGAERTGLVGRNGVGKTTLLKLITGELAPASGAVTVNGRVGVLRQAFAPPPGASAADALGVASALAVLARVEAGEASDDDLADADWTLEARLAQALEAVDLGGVDLTRAADSFSGGEATRLALAGLLLAQPDVLILDEPTNNLDAAARALVARVLAGWKGGAIVVSHDRALLRQTDRIVELSSLGARIYGGNFDLYEARKAEEEAAAARALSDAERAVARVSREAQVARERKDRRDAAGRRFAAKRSEPKILLGAMAERAEQSGGREKVLADRLRDQAQVDLNAAEARLERVRRLGFDLPPANLAAGKTVLSFDNVSFAYPGAPSLIANLSLRLTGPERIAVTGPNGAGKSTVLKLAVGDLTPTAGRVTLGARSALVDQRTAMLNEDETLVEAYRRLNPTATDNTAHAALARFLFRNVAAKKRVGDLSGGERLRAALACMLTGETPPQLLILDEPTNHLDLDSLAAVEQALAGYDGALLVVSHDPDFLEAIGIEREMRLKGGRTPPDCTKRPPKAG